MMLAVGYFMYSAVDMTVCCAIIRVCKRFCLISGLFCAQVILHCLAVMADIFHIPIFFQFYEYIMVFINILIVCTLFHGSFGHRVVYKCWLNCIGVFDSNKSVQAKKANYKGGF